MLDSLDILIGFVLIMLGVSLLITIAVQMVSAAFNLRGLNLAQGLKRTFAVISPDTDKNAKALANFVLKGRYLSDSFLPNWGIFKPWRHAEAIRPKEVFDAIQRIAIGKEPVDERKWKKTQRSGTDKEPATGTELGKESSKEQVVTDLKKTARELLIALGVEKQTLDNAEKNITEAGKPDELRALGTAAAEKIIAAEETVDAAYKKFEHLTCICQERAQQWLTMHTRILTIILAAVAAVGLQLDSVDIFKLVSSNKAVRDKLVAQSAAVASQAEKTLADSKTVLQSAYDAWLGKADPDVKAALNAIRIDPADTREKLITRIAAVLPSNIDKDAVLKSFDEAVNKTVTDLLSDRAHDYTGVRRDLDKTGFEVFPQKGWRWGEKWREGWTRRHAAGVLFSIGLLSLGAPFWYSALKNVVNLRSQVAQNISAEQKKKLPDSTSQPPKQRQG
jgi:hypothetical protein